MKENISSRILFSLTYKHVYLTEKMSIKRAGKDQYLELRYIVQQDKYTHKKLFFADVEQTHFNLLTNFSCQIEQELTTKLFLKPPNRTHHQQGF